MGFLCIYYLQIRNFSSFPIFISSFFVNFALFSYCIDYGFLIESIMAPVVMIRVHDDSAHFVIKLLASTPHLPVGGALSTYGREVRDAETSYIAQGHITTTKLSDHKVYDAKVEKPSLNTS